MRVEAIVVTGLLFAGTTLACTSIIGTRDLTLSTPDAAASTKSAERAPVTDGAEAGSEGEGEGAGERSEPEAGATAGDAGARDAEVSRGPNFVRENGVTATATTTYAGFPASRLIDGDVATSWYAGDGACTTSAAGFSCEGVSATVKLAAARTVGRLVLYGNHDKFTHYDVVAGRWELLGPNNTALAAVNVTLSPPSYNGTTVLPTAVTDVVAVRFVVLTGDAPDPGVGEIELYAR